MTIALINYARGGVKRRVKEGTSASVRCLGAGRGRRVGKACAMRLSPDRSIGTGPSHRGRASVTVGGFSRTCITLAGKFYTLLHTLHASCKRAHLSYRSCACDICGRAVGDTGVDKPVQSVRFRPLPLLTLAGVMDFFTHNISFSTCKHVAHTRLRQGPRDITLAGKKNIGFIFLFISCKRAPRSYRSRSRDIMRGDGAKTTGALVWTRTVATLPRMLVRIQLPPPFTLATHSFIHIGVFMRCKRAGQFAVLVPCDILWRRTI